MLFNGQITRDVWERLVNIAVEKEIVSRGCCNSHFSYQCEAISALIGTCFGNAKVWYNRAYEGDPVYPSMYIDKISKVLSEPLASDKMIFARLSTDPEYWANQDYSHLELVRKSIDDSEAVRIANAIKAEEAARKAENERKAKAKADALEKIKELSQKIKELADTAETCVSVTVW